MLGLWKVQRGCTWRAVFHGVLAVCFLVSAATWVGCRPEPEFVLGGVAPRMTVEEVDALGGRPFSTIGDGSFSWRWYKSGLIVGFSRSSTSGNLESCWIAQTAGSYAGGRLSVGDEWSRAQRLFGNAESKGQPRIHLVNEAGVCLDVMRSGEQVAAFVLYPPPGQAPDVRLAGYEPGSMPAFVLPKDGGIHVFPSAQGTTHVYLEYDDAGGSTVVRSVVLQPVDYGGRSLIPVQTFRGEAPAITFYFELTGDIVTLVAEADLHPVQYEFASPSRIYPGLEWSDSGDTYRVIGQEDVTVQAGEYPGAYVVEYSSALVPVKTLIYCVDGVGQVKEDDKSGLIEFIPGGP